MVEACHIFFGTALAPNALLSYACGQVQVFRLWGQEPGLHMEAGDKLEAGCAMKTTRDTRSPKLGSLDDALPKHSARQTGYQIVEGKVKA